MSISLFIANKTLELSNTTNVVDFVQTYAYSLSQLIRQGDIFAITISSIIFFVSLVIINKLTSLMLAFIKRVILFFLTSLAVYYFGAEFLVKLNTFGPTTEVILFGVIGALVGILGMFLSSYYLYTNIRQSIQRVKKGKYELPTLETLKGEAEKPTKTEEKSVLTTEIRSLKDELSLQLIKQDKNLLAVLVYIIIGEFGVFSSPTVVPSPQAGIVIFAIFILGTLLFVKQTYKNFSRGLSHLIIAFIFGLIISLLLGYFWGSYPLSILFSLNYFGTSCLVALITGMAVSLVMSSK